MKILYELLNKVNVELDDYEIIEVNDIDKSQMKKRIRNKIIQQQEVKKVYRRKSKKIYAILIAALMSSSIFGIVIAHPYYVYNTLEALVGNNNLKEYKTVVNQTVTSKGIDIKLQEVLLDQRNMNITMMIQGTSLEQSDWINVDLDVYINGKQLSGGQGQGSSKKEGGLYTLNARIGIDSNKIVEGELDIELRIKGIDMHKYESDEYETLKGEWKFAFKTNRDELISHLKNIEVNKEFRGKNGYKLIVENIELTPANTVLTYRMNNLDHSIGFLLEDEKGNKLESGKGHVSDNIEKLSYANYKVLPKTAQKLKVTPYINYNEDGDFSIIIATQEDGTQKIYKQYYDEVTKQYMNEEYIEVEPVYRETILGRGRYVLQDFKIYLDDLAFEVEMQ